VQIEDKNLSAGDYGFFIAMSETDAELIFSKNTTSWGSYFYDPKEDALRVKVKTEKNSQGTERLKYEFSDQNDNSTIVNLVWEKMKIPFKVKVDLVQTQLESFRKELRTNKGFNPDAWVQAAAFSVQHNTNLEEALTWSDYAINAVFVGQKNFKTLTGKANVLRKLGRTSEADALMKEAIPLANMQEMHQYARQLLRDKRHAEALGIYKLNAAKNPNQFTTNLGLARGYSATGDFKNALKYARLAEGQAPDKTNKDAVGEFIKKLQEGKDIN
jgi:tetratricopeptide (TPR) repeat protein